MLTLTQKLEKCRNSLEAHAGRGNTPAGLRSMHLIDRYQGLRNQIIDDEVALAEWAAYCQDNDLSFRHNAGDFFA